MNDGKIIHVALDGLENILRAGQEEFQSDANLTVNPYCIMIEESEGENLLCLFLLLTYFVTSLRFLALLVGHRIVRPP